MTENCDKCGKFTHYDESMGGLTREALLCWSCWCKLVDHIESWYEK